MVERFEKVVTATETKPKLFIEVQRPAVKLVEIKPPQPRQVDDDWFELLDVGEKVSGILLLPQPG